MGYKSREEILALTKRRYTEVDGICLQSLSEVEMSTLRGLWATRAGDIESADDETKHKTYLQGRSELLCMTIVDGSGQRVFSNDDIAVVQQIDHDVFERLYDAAAKHTGLAAKSDEVDKLEKKSDSPAG
jgi:hypothetical protein